MTTGMYDRGAVLRERAYYDEFMTDRFYPGEFGMVILLAVASLLLWSLAVYGLTNDPQPKQDTTYSNGAY